MDYAEGKSVGELMGRFTVKKTTGGVNSPFNEAVDQVKNAITDQRWSFARWCGFLKNIPADEILSMLTVSKKSPNVGRHFNWLVGQYKQKKRPAAKNENHPRRG
jgi:hypothetical protein